MTGDPAFPGLAEYRAQMRSAINLAVREIAEQTMREVTAKAIREGMFARLVAEARDPFFPREHS